MKAIKNPFVNKIISWDVVFHAQLDPTSPTELHKGRNFFVDKVK
jgi:hypothetical protein